MIGTELVDMGRSSLGTYNDIELGSDNGTAGGKYEVLLIGA